MRYEDEVPVDDIELGTCPVCRFTEEDHLRLRSRWGGHNHWDLYCPVLYTSRLLNQTVVECQNCDFVMFGKTDEIGTAEIWNGLSKAVIGDL